MSDLVERLRRLTFIDETGEAADEIERLQAEYRIQNDCIADQHDTIRDLQADNERLRADSKRMDYLESEAIREIDLQAPRSLFRRNVPITREAVDEALATIGEGK